MQGGVRRDNDLRNAPAAREPEADPDQASLIRTIQLNFDQLHLAAVHNRIFVYDAATLKPIDVSSCYKTFCLFFLPWMLTNHHMLSPRSDIVRPQASDSWPCCGLDAAEHRVFLEVPDRRRDNIYGALPG